MNKTSSPIAHLRASDRATHGLTDHLKGTADRAAAFAAAFGAGDMARLAGLWHDLGKYAADFQAMIRAADTHAHLEGQSAPSGRRRVDHSTAGAQWAVEMEQLGPYVGRLLAYVIAGHHAGLADWNAAGGRRGLDERLSDRRHLEAMRAAAPPGDILNQTASLSTPADVDAALWIRMLASALFDADFLDTEEFFDDARAGARAGWPELTALKARLDAYMSGFDGASGRVNAVRAEVLAACRARATDPPGLFSLTVPTGGGKTLSGLTFALDHALANGLRRVIHAAPFTSIIDQTANDFRKAFGNLDGVLEHHSNLDPDDVSPRARLASENWDAPVVVTTTVQLFESLCASRTSRVRKLHNIAGSVVVLDEAQALPAHLLKPITMMIDQLRHFGATVVLCTATQPALGAVFPDLPTPTEIAPDPPRLFAVLERVRMEVRPNVTSWDDLAAEIAEERQALAIVNTRADARALHERLPAGTIHLSTWQCAAHRAGLLDAVCQRLKDGKPIHVVSTSLIEAGVNLDFPAVFRAMAGLDSLAQAAGRCNREGKLDGLGRFVVFRPETRPPKGHLGQAAAAAEPILREQGSAALNPEAFQCFFQDLYFAKGEALDDPGICKLLRMGKQRREGDPLAFQFRSAAEAFRMIEDGQTPVLVPFGDGRDLIETLRRDGPSRDLLRRLQRFTVPVTRQAHQALSDAGALAEVEGLIVLERADFYDAEVGLRFEGDAALIH
ncbi:CRISPR-associated endonuclease Cas3'' [uncultured Rhodospira sp.]|uniref:CRISPR-associated endonuclease Cas3'' n=1 Tax=uncultured Rhodospira sp. TaxID=1936189 RepID=UPI002607CFD8|nr:CRISPR-associated endonuclease Cas3'' [uncultured Rhodospira sp.]